jgi:hypothetical protein
MRLAPVEVEKIEARVTAPTTQLRRAMAQCPNPPSRDQGAFCVEPFRAKGPCNTLPEFLNP